MKIAIAGYGVVGRGTHELLLMNRGKIAARAGEEIEVKYVLDPKPLEGTPAEQLKASGIEEILADPEVKLLVEAIGGVGPAYEYVKAQQAVGGRKGRRTPCHRQGKECGLPVRSQCSGRYSGAASHQPVPQGQ